MVKTADPNVPRPLYFQVECLELTKFARMRLERIRFISGEANGRRGRQDERPTQETVDAWEAADDYADWRGADFACHPACAGEF